MEVEHTADNNSNDLEQALASGRDNTQPGSIVSNCFVLFGSNEGDCLLCTKPCLHPLSTEDLRSFFHNDQILVFDWIDDSTCIVVCKDPSVVATIISEFFHLIATDESGIEWYQSNNRVAKETDTDEYGEKGKVIYIYARGCLTSDIERKERMNNSHVLASELKKAKMINSIIKRRREQRKLKELASKVKKKNKKRKQKKAKAKEKAKEVGIEVEKTTYHV